MSRHLPLLIEIDRVFDFFNERFAQGQLKKPIISLSPCNGVPQYGWFGVSGWKQGLEDLYEINLAAEYLNREPYAIIETLIHEMAHLWNHQNNIVDVDFTTQCHFETFKVAAEMFGLKVKKRRPKGYAYTHLGQPALQALDELQLNMNVFGFYLGKLTKTKHFV